MRRNGIDGATVLGLSRESCRKGSIDLRDTREVLGYPGFDRVAVRSDRISLVHNDFRNSESVEGMRGEVERRP